MPLAESRGICKGMIVKVKSSNPVVNLSNDLLGRVINGTSEFIDGKPYAPTDEVEYPLYREPLNPRERGFITESLDVGVRSINALMTIGRGQRMGIMAGSGVGKSVLLGMMAKNTTADVNIIALIGERGREVREFIQNNLGEEGLKRSVLVVATSNESPLSRIRGAYLATTIAEFFRDRRKDVVLMFDSVTRFARAQREIGLAIGEPPANRGFTPSVFSTLPKLLERSGTSDRGTITGFYTILVEGDDMDEPVSDTVRGILDGHIVLSKKLAARHHYPAIDVLSSISRLSTKINGPATKKASAYIKRMLAVYTEAEDLINVGAYVKGSNPVIDEAIEKIPGINEFLRQGIEEKSDVKKTLTWMEKITSITIPDSEIPNETVSVQT